MRNLAVMPNKGATSLDSMVDKLKSLLSELLSVTCAPLPESIGLLTVKFDELSKLTSSLSVSETEVLLVNREISQLVKSVYHLRAEYEYYHEQACAVDLLSDLQSTKKIRQYTSRWYPSTSLHSERFRAVSEKSHHCLVVGCGAIPSTIMLVGENTPLKITGIDRCSKSVQLAHRVLSVWGRQPITLHAIDVFSMTDFSQWDCIFLNALVGVSRDSKRVLLQHLFEYCEKDTLLFVRTPHLVNRWLYASLDLSNADDHILEYISPPLVDRSGLTILRM